MIFNKNAYLIKNDTRNNTNTKDYSLLNEDYIYEVTFKYNSNNEDNECCVFGRSGYKFGIFIVESESLHQSEEQFKKINNSIKWCWFREEKGEIIYDDIFFGIDGTDEKLEYHLNWWRTYIDKESPILLDEHIINGLSRRWGLFDGTFSLEQIEDKSLYKWASKIEKGRNKTGSYTTDVVKVSVKKEGSIFKMYINDVFYYQKQIGNIIDYSNQTICIGMDDPYKDNGEPQWFNGEIYDLKIYNDSLKSNHTLYTWLDFTTKTQFKLFDLSKNGNHAELYETEEFKELKNKEFNIYSRPAKII